MNLSKNVDIREVLTSQAAGSSIDANSDRIDMSGYDGVVFIVPITDSTDTGVVTLTIEENSADSDTGMTAITGASATNTSAADDDLNGELLVVDVFRPQERYVQGVLTTATANGAFGNMIAILYGGSKKPHAAHSTISAATTAVGS